MSAAINARLDLMLTELRLPSSSARCAAWPLPRGGCSRPARR